MFGFAHVLKKNTYHDAKGRFTSKDKAVDPQGDKPAANDHGSSGQSLADYAKKFDDPNVTAASVLSKITAAQRGEIALKTIKSQNAPTSKQVYTDKDGNYTPERLALHNKIINEILSPHEIDRATPAEGQKPTFVVLGGRGGSGKSSFTNGKIKEFDASKFIKLDSDEIKGKLRPPYEGWNAFSVHDESSDIFDKVTHMAKAMGLNLIHDATLKSKSVERTITEMKDDGYDIEGHYMYVPRQEAARRALGRYLGKDGKRGRLVPVDVILANTRNEQNFDELKQHFTKWSAYDNQGSEPVLITRSTKRSKQ